MKQLLLSLIVIWSSIIFGQDTLSGYTRYDGAATYLISDGIDTFTLHYYPNGNLDSKTIQSSVKRFNVYKRYYPSGELMWTKEQLGNKYEGKSTYFREDGKRVAEFVLKNDSIVDTTYLSKKHTILMGHMSYSSVVHGGMQREDGSSNISRSSGNRIHADMYTVKLDSTLDKQEVYQEFRSDLYGDFFLCVEEGDFGFFDKRHDINLVRPNMGVANPSMGMSIEASWNLNSPFKVKKGTLNSINLHYSSVGYAP